MPLQREPEVVTLGVRDGILQASITKSIILKTVHINSSNAVRLHLIGDQMFHVTAYYAFCHGPHIHLSPN